MNRNISRRPRRAAAFLAGPVVTVGLIGLIAPTASADIVDTVDPADTVDAVETGDTVDVVEESSDVEQQSSAPSPAAGSEEGIDDEADVGVTEGETDGARGAEPRSAEPAEDGDQAAARGADGADGAGAGDADDAGDGEADQARSGAAGPPIQEGDVDEVEAVEEGNDAVSADATDRREQDGEAVQQAGSGESGRTVDTDDVVDEDMSDRGAYSSGASDLPDEPTSGWLGAAPKGNQGGGRGLDGMSDEIRDYMSDVEEYDEDLWWEYDPDAATVCALPERGSEDLGPLEEGPDDGSTGVWGSVAGDQFWAVYNDYYDVLAFVPAHQLWREGTDQPLQAYSGCGGGDFYDPQGMPRDAQAWRDLREGDRTAAETAMQPAADQETDPDPQGAPKDLADWQLYYELGLDEPGEELMPPGALQKLYDHPAYTGAGHGGAADAQTAPSDGTGQQGASAHGGDQLAETGTNGGTLALGAGLFVLIGGALSAFAHRARLTGRRG